MPSTSVAYSSLARSLSRESAAARFTQYLMKTHDYLQTNLHDKTFENLTIYKQLSEGSQ